MTATSLTPEQRASITQQAQAIAAQQGITPEQALYNYSKKEGISQDKLDSLMGFESGATVKWLGSQSPDYIFGLPQGTTQSAVAPSAPVQGAQGQGYLGDANRDSIIAQANARAQANGSTPERELYTYGKTNGYDNAGIDTAMGFESGATGKWLAGQGQNLGMGQSANPTQPTQPTQPGANGQQGQGYNPQQNPYLGQMGKDIGNQMFDNWSRNQMPSIRSGAMAAGGFGGSRQGVVEANGMNDMNRQYGQALTSMYGNDWSNQQSRNLQATSTQNQYNLGLGQLGNQAQSTANQYDLGLRSNDLGFAGLDANIYQNNFNNQVTGANLGLNAYNALNNSNAGGTAAAGTAQNQPLNYFNNASDKTNGVANGFGSSTSSQTNPGNPMLGALGGAQLGSQLYNQYMGSQVQDNGYSTGTGSAYAGTTTNGVWSPNRAGM